MTFSVPETLAGREILLTGASGFVGKVWLLMLLDKCPDIGRIHLLVRPNGDGDALARFERIVNESPAFGPLHERYAADLGDMLRQKVVVHSGDLTKLDLGLDPATFGGRLDLVANCAAVTDFEPDVRHAFKTNTQGCIHAAELARDCGAGMVQVSTCYVAGRRDGSIAEERFDVLPNGGLFDAEAEYADLQTAIDDLEAYQASEDFEQDLLYAAEDYLEERGEDFEDEAAVAKQAERMRKRFTSDAWAALGTDRASERGWPNTYTYTKGIAEGLLSQRFGNLRAAVVRPAVVETSMEFPFPGWNEGFNTCGPLAYLMGTWFKAMPGRERNPFDVVPVDHVGQALGIVAAAVIRGENHLAYNCASSDRNALTVGRATGLTVLEQRRWLRRNGKTAAQRFLKSRSDTTVFEDGHPASLENVAKLMKLASAGLRLVPDRAPQTWQDAATLGARALDKNRRQLDRVTYMVNAFLPFIRDLRQTFVANNLSSHGSDGDFAWRPEDIDWRDYWMNTHMPGMRKWSFPLFKGKEPPKLEPEHRVDLHARQEAAE